MGEDYMEGETAGGRGVVTNTRVALGLSASLPGESEAKEIYISPLQKVELFSRYKEGLSTAWTENEGNSPHNEIIQVKQAVFTDLADRFREFMYRCRTVSLVMMFSYNAALAERIMRENGSAVGGDLQATLESHKKRLVELGESYLHEPGKPTQQAVERLYWSLKWKVEEPLHKFPRDAHFAHDTLQGKMGHEWFYGTGRFFDAFERTARLNLRRPPHWYPQNIGFSINGGLMAGDYELAADSRMKWNELPADIGYDGSYYSNVILSPLLVKVKMNANYGPLVERLFGDVGSAYRDRVVQASELQPWKSRCNDV
ncbi:MAG: hypothetical protein HY518_02600 [Candidatus Aenigmarchaeota archaeon]|nr:hypothetical protein [Candidatus Aenigmarchaeota archaeon]